MAEGVVQHVLKRLDVVDDIPVEHSAFAHFASIKFIDLITHEMHCVDGLVDRGLRFCDKIAEI